MKPLLIGEMPSRSGDRYYAFPLSGAVAQAMCQMAGIPPQADGTRYGRWTWALYDHFDCINAIERHQVWDSIVAGERLKEAIGHDREVVVLLGRRPQTAYVRMQEPATSLLEGADWFEWVTDSASPTGRRQVVVVPHPSSLNRTHSEAHARWRAGLTLQTATQKAAELHETRL